MKRPVPFLWLEGRAEEAARFYARTFKGTRVRKVSRWGPGAPAPEGSVMSVELTLAGQPVVLFNGGPHYALTPAFSLVVACDDQREIDRLWRALTARGGEAQMCGWLVDRFGLSWQIVPRGLPELLAHPKAAAQLLTMKKIDVAALRAAAGTEAGRTPRRAPSRASGRR
jgi:predicted 3-demethylubiquinone-9 3-methyltransferase (glyoxalase superfamily)